MSGAGKTGDRGGGRESTKSLNKSKITKHKIEVDKKKQREQFLLTRPKFSPFAPPITLPAAPSDGGPPAIIDASCHLLSRSFNRDLIAVMRRAKESGVVACVLHCDWTRIAELISLVKQWPGQMFATIGVSPDVIKKSNDKVFETRMEQLLDLALTPEVVAVACGLDLTRDMATHFLQAKLFAAQVALARQVRLPLLVSEKAASEAVVDQLQAARNSEGVDRVTPAASSAHPHGKPDPIVLSATDKTAFFPRVAIHNFNGSAADLERFLAADCFIMINGVVCDVKEAGAAASPAAPTQAEQDKAKADKAKRDEEAKEDAKGRGEEQDDEEEEEEEEVEESETSDGTGFKAQALVGPADLSGAGAHLFHLLRSGLLPLDRLLVSTDAPLHTPQNISDFYIRTSRNEPSNMPHIFTVLARAYSLPVEDVCAQVFRNSKAFFGLLNQAEAAAEEEKHAEKERAKQAEEKKLVDKHARSEAEARKKAEREKAEAEAALEATTGGGKKKKDKKQVVVAPTAASDSEDDGGKKKKGKGGKGGAAPKKSAPKAHDSDEDSDEGWGKQKTKTNLKVQQKKQQLQKKKQNKKRNQGDSDEESEEEEEEVKPAAKGKKAAAAAAAPAPAKKAAKKAVSSSSESESESESSEDEKPAPKKKAAPPAAKAKAKKAAVSSSSESDSESESSSEDEKPVAAKKKAAPAKKAAKAAVESESESSESSESSDSDSDDGGSRGTKRSAETIAADKRARAAAIKASQEAAKDRRKLGEDSAAKGAKGKGAKGAKGKAAEDEEIDELDDMFMASNIDGLAAAAAEAKRKLEESKKAAAAAAAASGALGSGGVGEETVTFRCRRCQTQLFTNAEEVGHRDSAASAQGDLSACEQIFIRRPEWLSEDTVEAAASSSAAVDLCCLKCNAKIGRVSVSAPLPCACGRLGAGSSPFVSVKMSRIDALTTAATSVRGPRAMDADELDKRKQDEADNIERLRQKEKERLNEKRKVKNASKMPVNNQIGNFTQFRNKSNAPEAAPKKKRAAADSDSD